MTESDQRRSRLDLDETELAALAAGVQALAERELQALRNGPIFDEPPSAARIARLLSAERDLPLEGQPVEAVLETCGALLGTGRRTAPAFFGYVLSPASPVGAAADLLASVANQNVTAWRSAPAATQLEQIVIRWLGQFVGFSDDAGGILVSGGSMANLTALLMAIRARGEPDGDRRRLVAYGSAEVHFSVGKAAGALGVEFRHVAVDGERRLHVPALAEAIAADRAAGLMPFCVVATAGATATGAVDDIAALADAAAQNGLWLHIDGAYGAPAAAVESQRHLFAGIERADSLAIDPHKWLYVPIDCGALLARPGAAAFGSGDADYVRVMAEDEIERFAFWDHGLELSRRFRALKLWMTFRYYGARRLGEAIAQDVALAAYMAELVREADDLELLAEPSLSVCCFRHVPPGLAEGDLDNHNERLLQALQRGGAAYLSNARVDGSLALRACIMNFRTARSDVERTVALVCEIGEQLALSSS